MLKLTLTTIAAPLLVLCLGATVTRAQPSRVFVAAQGLDSSPCTFAQPCRSFQKGHDAVAAGGEIDVLDPAGYGAVTITKAISIQGHGFAGIAAPGSNAITINAGTADKVNLRWLLIDGIGTGGHGIALNTGASLSIQDCLIRNVGSGSGVVFVPSASSNLSVSNTVISDHSGNGVYVAPTGSGTVNVVLDHVEMGNTESDPDTTGYLPSAPRAPGPSKSPSATAWPRTVARMELLSCRTRRQPSSWCGTPRSPTMACLD